MRWQRSARFVMAAVVVGVCVAVFLTFRRGGRSGSLAPLVRTDPRAVVESIGGTAMRFKSGHEDVRVEYERQLTYQDGSTKLIGVKVSTDDRGDGRSFVVTGKEGDVAKGESVVTLTGDVKLVEKDGFTARTVRASYDNTDGLVRAPGPVDFFHGRLSGSGQGMTYDKNTDTLTILDQAIVHMAPDGEGAGGAEVTAGTATFPRRQQLVRFDRAVRIVRDGKVITADTAVAHLTANEEHVESLELHGGAKIAGTATAAGGLQGLGGQDVTLKYAADGQALEHAQIAGDASLQIAGEAGTAPRQILAGTIDVSLAADGSTPTALTARDAVQLTLPPDSENAARTIKAASLDADGEPRRGLTRARFSGNVDYRERSATADRTARSARLDIGLKQGFSAFDQALFSGGVRFADPKFFGTAAAVKYVVESAALDMTGSEPAIPVPHISTEQITVDSTRIEVVLGGPMVHATGDVKSVLDPPKKSDKAAPETKIPSMLKQDQPVKVTAASLQYDGATSKATYEGMAQLWQADTSIKGDVVGIDSKTGDLWASGSVVTTTMLDQVDKDNKKKDRVRNVGTSKEFAYDDSRRLATYTGDVHLNGPNGDVTAQTFEAYLKESGSELERAEGHDTTNSLTLREQGRKTTGTHLTFTSADDQYVVTGLPVTIVDPCGRETKGRTLTFHRATDTIQIDSNDRARTQTKGGSDKCQ
jgi:LPS export ABC transporter protein LptC